MMNARKKQKNIDQKCLIKAIFLVINTDKGSLFIGVKGTKNI